MNNAEEVAARLFKLETMVSGLAMQRGHDNGATVDQCVAITERIAHLEARKGGATVEQVGGALAILVADVATVFSGLNQPTPDFSGDPFPTKATLSQALRPLRDLLLRVEALETRPTMSYAGTWTEGERYSQGQSVSLSGSLWSCLEDTDERPGGSPNWRLIVKRGRA